MIRRALDLLALVLLVSPTAARSQPSGRGQRIGVLPHDGAPPGLLETFRAGLRDLGHVEGKTVTIETRDAAGRTERLGPLADELVRLRVDVLGAAHRQLGHRVSPHRHGGDTP
ncbi:MAG TPA: hypothetical protein VLK35_04250 [Methylomirabilota bacterium]|nr:hypothetical protein [Methylomirabilota bacterium]